MCDAVVRIFVSVNCQLSMYVRACVCVRVCVFKILLLVLFCNVLPNGYECFDPTLLLSQKLSVRSALGMFGLGIFMHIPVMYQQGQSMLMFLGPNPEGWLWASAWVDFGRLKCLTWFCNLSRLWLLQITASQTEICFARGSSIRRKSCWLRSHTLESALEAVWTGHPDEDFIHGWSIFCRCFMYTEHVQCMHTHVHVFVQVMCIFRISCYINCKCIQ